MIRIGTAPDLLEVSRLPSGDIEVTLVGPHIRASHTVRRHYADDGFGDLAKYFTSLEASWRGWEGEREWRSLEGELRVVARHAGSHVALTVALAGFDPASDRRWFAEMVLRLDAGAQLSGAADDVAREVGWLRADAR
ncbi:DUF6228 family protein [Cellulomonas alba]|uniref:DUF6228 family protein n=1 Tax=Cellulomonas alba TaxID=3053467 RepID=A0ABT7SH43_9CELL|nr:DUF6228 family protein [Cellulomonas alba]MDM7855506.1 DUF6228 family protein [Cellulomonas alba]